MEKFSIRLKKALSLRDMSQTELCALTDIPKSAISQYLSGSFKPKQTRTYILAKALNVNPAWLMGYDVPIASENSFSNTNQLSISNKYNLLNTLGQQKTNDYIDDLLKLPEYTKDIEKKVSLSDIGNQAAEGGEEEFHRQRKKKPHTTL